MIRINPDNVIVFDNTLTIYEIRKFGGFVKNLAGDSGPRNITLDFSGISKAFPGAMLPLIANCAALQKRGVSFFVTLPKNQFSRRLFLNCGWAHALNPEYFEAPEMRDGDHLPVRRFADATEQDTIVKDVIAKILRNVPYLERNALDGFEWSLIEICDNVINHSQSQVGGYVQFSPHKTAKEIEFIVSDCGIGIPESLRSIRNREWSDLTALQQCVKKGVTRDTAYGQGNGLFGSYRVAELSGGTFSINSGFAHLNARDGQPLESYEDNIVFPGTTVLCRINYSRPPVLAQALHLDAYEFHSPLENNYLQDCGFLRVRLADEASSVGSRHAGLEIRNMGTNMMARYAAHGIVFECSGLGVMSSSFADELFGKLAVSLGVDDYKKKIRISGISSLNSNIVNMAVCERLAEASKNR